MISNIKYELYQANVDFGFAFMSYDFLEKKGMNEDIIASNYKKVITGTIKEADSVFVVLEKLFHDFNSDSPRSFRSMSVSDVVIIIYTDGNTIYTRAYYCDSFGWKELDVSKFLGEEVNCIQKKMTLEEYIVTYLNSYGKGDTELDCNHCPLCDECTEHYMNSHGGNVPSSLKEVSCKSFFKEYFGLTT